MTATNYSEARRAMAKAIGLGRKPKTATENGSAAAKTAKTKLLRRRAAKSDANT